MKVDTSKLGERITILRVQRGLFLRDIAEETGYCSQHIFKVEKGERKITPALLAELCEAMELSENDRCLLLCVLQKLYRDSISSQFSFRTEGIICIKKFLVGR
jgi:transcriptional regulator with XRE-family HTH domain